MTIIQRKAKSLDNRYCLNHYFLDDSPKTSLCLPPRLEEEEKERQDTKSYEEAKQSPDVRPEVVLREKEVVL